MLKVCEIFGPTLQGEGKTAGMKCLFLRLAHCNLDCIWCDTPYTWKWDVPCAFKGEEHIYRKSEEVHLMSYQEVFSHLVMLGFDSIQSLVISGGEPLVQEKELISFLQYVRSQEYLSNSHYHIEVETNATIFPKPELVRLVNQFNCSPKLSNSGVDFRKRIKSDALVEFVRTGKANFKFVVATDQDALEVVNVVQFFGMEDVYMMPEGVTAEELERHRELVKELCDRFKFKFTDRLHVVRFGGVRGV